MGTNPNSDDAEIGQPVAAAEGAPEPAPELPPETAEPAPEPAPEPPAPEPAPEPPAAEPAPELPPEPAADSAPSAGGDRPADPSSAVPATPETAPGEDSVSVSGPLVSGYSTGLENEFAMSQNDDHRRAVLAEIKRVDQAAFKRVRAAYAELVARLGK